MALQTVIMAGGEGVRLRPLTQSMPKPLSPLCGEAVMGYTLRLLQRHGIDHATATLWYRPEDVMREFGTGRHGVQLRYSTEETPLGTAGSVRKAVEGSKDTTLVLSGDGLTACDLKHALAFHRARGAAATLVLTQVDIPLAYGVVVTGEDGRILRFIEKPDWSRVIGSLVNTGIYFLEPEVLSLIPRDEPYDFGRQLFPRLLQMGLPLYGYISREYWCDVGDPAAFLRAQGDLLTGRAGFAATDMGIRKLKDGYISFDSYVDAAARVAPDAVIRGSCVLPGAKIESGAHLTDSIVCAGAQVGRGSVLLEGSVLGAGARLGDFSRCEGGRVWSHVKTLPGTVVRTVVARQQSALCVRDGQALAQEPVHIAQLAGAFLQARKAKKVIVMYSDSAVAAYALWLGALACYGAQQVIDGGCGTFGMLGHAVRMQNADGGILVSLNQVLLLDENGMRLSDAAGAQVQSAWQQQAAPCVQTDENVIRRDTAQRGEYLKMLSENLRAENGLSVQVTGGDAFLQALVKDALWQTGHAVAEKSDTVLHIAGRKMRLYMGKRTNDAEIEWLLCARALRQAGRKVYDTEGFGTAVDELSPLEDSPECRFQQTLMADELAKCLLLLQLFSRETPEKAVEALPSVARKMIEIPCETRDKGRVLEALMREAAPCRQGGLEKVQETSRVHIRPDPVLPLLRITAYARSAENAQELCDFLGGRIRRELKRMEKNASALTHSSS